MRQSGNDRVCGCCASKAKSRDNVADVNAARLQAQRKERKREKRERSSSRTLDKKREKKIRAVPGKYMVGEKRSGMRSKGSSRESGSVSGAPHTHYFEKEFARHRTERHEERKRQRRLRKESRNIDLAIARARLVEEEEAEHIIAKKR